MNNKEIRQGLEKVFNIINGIAVKGVDVENMYAVKCILRDVYSALQDEEDADGR